MTIHRVSFAVAAVLCAAVVLNAAPPRGREAMKDHARGAIKKTAAVIHIAHKKLKENRVYTGDLARSVAHQRFARKLYAQGHYLKAIHHARRARVLAFLAIKANRGEVPKNAELAQNDLKSMPEDSSLDAELQKEMPGQTMRDEDLLAQISDLDVD
ncbi:MAG: hypothetical protein MUC76_01405 [Spirochaetes bacterium]|nr:hypothetical protein [Spirochaetota bacterium]